MKNKHRNILAIITLIAGVIIVGVSLFFLTQNNDNAQPASIQRTEDSQPDATNINADIEQETPAYKVNDVEGKTTQQYEGEASLSDDDERFRVPEGE